MGFHIKAHLEGRSAGDLADLFVIAELDIAHEVGYLPKSVADALNYFCAEAYAANNSWVEIPTALLRSRLKETLKRIKSATSELFCTTEEMQSFLQCFERFVELCELCSHKTGGRTSIVVYP